MFPINFKSLTGTHYPQYKTSLIAHDHAKLCDSLRDSECSFKNHETFHDHGSLITISTVKEKTFQSLGEN